MAKGTAMDALNGIANIGGAEGDRTPDLMTASHALSQLSYGPVWFSARFPWLDVGAGNDRGEHVLTQSAHSFAGCSLPVAHCHRHVTL